jgi:adenylate kinase
MQSTMSGGGFEESTRQRKRPNILVTGTPGVGKTATASLLAASLGLRHINVGELIAQHKCYDGYDNELDTHILDEDKLLDLMESIFQNCAMEGIGIVADYHTCELFPERWFDLILVLRANTDVLFDRLTERGYSEKKRGENLEAEIMQVVLDEARESYEEDIVQELPSNTVEEMNSNIDRCRIWMEHWIQNNNNS